MKPINEMTEEEMFEELRSWDLSTGKNINKKTMKLLFFHIKYDCD